GNWETWTASGRSGDLRYINSVGVANYPSNNIATAGVARWSFTSLPVGQYRVSATWPDPDGTSGRATNAPYRVLDNVGGATLASVPRDQNLAPDDRTDQGSDWEDIATVNITAGILIVELANGNSYVMADAIRIERLGPPADTSADSASGDSGVSSGGSALTAGDTTAGTIADGDATAASTGQQVVLAATAAAITVTADKADDNAPATIPVPYAFTLVESLPTEEADSDAE
ncbi:MAG: hypothetical protein SH850_29805, partial [Planctomycetaceae bacterium]|nr:hypothetical protein [Planctomycetaceae bacterium]